MRNSKRKIHLFDVVNISFMIVIMIIMLYPMYYTVIASFSDPAAVANHEVVWLPKGFRTDAYKYVFEYEPLWTGYANSIYYTVAGTLLALAFTIPTGYVMSKRDLPCKKAYITFYMISMYFGGTMVPMYLQVKRLGLLDTRTVLIVLGALSIYNMLVTKSFFEGSVPESLYEAARIDGAGQIRCFFSIALPLAKPIIAVISLYSAVAKWNDYFNALLYIKSPALNPLQAVLREVLMINSGGISNQMIDMMGTEELLGVIERQRMAYTMKYAVVFIASAPLLALYPFIQKYFVKGVMIGAVKE